MFRRKHKTGLLERFAQYKQTAEYFAQQLRLDLSDLVLRGLRREPQMTQRDLATKYGKGESFISRLINGDYNCSFGVAARVLFVLGIRPKLVDADEWERLKAQQPRRETPAETGEHVTAHTATATATRVILAGRGAFVHRHIRGSTSETRTSPSVG